MAWLINLYGFKEIERERGREREREREERERERGVSGDARTTLGKL